MANDVVPRQETAVQEGTAALADGLPLIRQVSEVAPKVDLPLSASSAEITKAQVPSDGRDPL